MADVVRDRNPVITDENVDVDDDKEDNEDEDEDVNNGACPASGFPPVRISTSAFAAAGLCNVGCTNTPCAHALLSGVRTSSRSTDTDSTEMLMGRAYARIDIIDIDDGETDGFY